MAKGGAHSHSNGGRRMNTAEGAKKSGRGLQLAGAAGVQVGGASRHDSRLEVGANERGF